MKKMKNTVKKLKKMWCDRKAYMKSFCIKLDGFHSENHLACERFLCISDRCYLSKYSFAFLNEIPSMISFSKSSSSGNSPFSTHFPIRLQRILLKYSCRE